MDTFPRELIVPGRIVCARGSADALLREAAAFGPRGILVHGASLERSGVLARMLGAAGKDIEARAWRHPGGEPTLDHVETLLAVARTFRPDWIAAAGGGSVMDVAKAAAGLLAAPAPLVSYHDGAPLPTSRTPFLAVPTTAGTGSETTTVSVLTNAATNVKKSIRHPSHMARAVILDPALLESCPKSVMAASGMDALTQAMEAFTSRHATWMSDAWALKAVELIGANLAPACGGEGGPRYESLLLGSMLAGLALSHARLGIVHGLAHPLGARYHAAHGLVCAVCLPIALEFNRDDAGGKYARLCRALDGDAVERVRALLTGLGLVSPFRGRRVADRAGIVEETLASGSTKANPRAVEPGDVEWFLDRIFEH
jgi:alcohol dehydrogenase class IV